jgi:hypothetical protein
MLEMQKAMLETRLLLAEQRNFQEKISSSMRALGEAYLNTAKIEDNKVKDCNKLTDMRDAIDGVYEIVDEDTVKPIEEEKDMSNIEQSEKLAVIAESISNQIKMDNTEPFFVEGKVTGPSEDTIVFSPIIFTVRNRLWRARVRHVLKSYYFDTTTNSLKIAKKQLNDDAVTVVLYNSKLEPVEIVVISIVPLATYICSDEAFGSVVKRDVTMISLNKLVNTVAKSFGLKLKYYHHLYEPELKSSNTPKVLTPEDITEEHYKADIMTFTPVLSFDVKEQSVIFETYNRAIFKRQIREY